jgi:Regulator of chromosome condensation (RCC1) repeat
MRGEFFSVVALGLLLSACGGGGGDAGGSSSGGTGGTGGSGGGGTVAVLSHNAGMNCMTCHRSGGTGAAKGIFTVAGTVYRNDGSAQTNATVILVPSGSNTIQATLTTDGLGNFFTTQTVAALVPAAGQQFALGANVTVRPAGGTSRTMPGVITNGSCNSCHSSSGGVARVTAQLADPVSADANVRAMAASGSGESTSPTLARIATGAAHACVVKTDGQVLCWGAGSHGELGSESLAETATPLPVAALGHVLASGAAGSIAAGEHHTCVVSAPAGNVLCWGDNERGQLGNGTTEAARVSAVALSGVTALAAVGDATCARTGTGTDALFYCWGTDGLFHDLNPVQVNPDANPLPALLALQLPAVSDFQALRQVAGLDSVSFAQIANNADRGCGITRDDHIKCWEGQRASVDIPLP